VIVARYLKHSAGLARHLRGRRVFALYLNVFVLLAQLF